MLYNILYNSALWKKLDTKSRNIRIMVLSSVLYVIILSFLYSKYVEDIEIINNYKAYIYYIMICDLIVYCGRMFIADEKKNKKKKKKHPLSLQYPMQMMFPNRLPASMNMVNLPRPQPIPNMNANMNLNIGKPAMQPCDDIPIPIYENQNQNNNNHQEVVETEEIPIYNSVNQQEC